MKIGVIGLGAMGFGISKNLISKGHEVFGYDIDPEKSKALRDVGGFGCSSLSELAQNVNSVIAMVFSPDNLREIVLGEHALFANLHEGATLIVTASVGPQIIEELEPKLKTKKINILDVPVMAGPEGAAKGTMKMLVSGYPDVVQAYMPLIQDMSAKRYFIGDKPGMAQTGKMCLQTLFCLSWEAACEVIALGDLCKLNAAEMSKLYRDCPAYNELFSTVEENVRSRTFTGTGERLAILNKDINICMDYANRNGVSMPASRATLDMYNKAIEKYPSEDVFSVAKIIEAETQTKNE